MKLLYFSPASYGGIADYAHEQANALVDLRVEVTLLCSPQYPKGRGEKYKIVPILKDIQPEQNIKNKLFKKIHLAKVILANFTKLANYIEEHKFQYVLLGSYTEYLAPLWSNRLQKLANNGVIFGAVVHDPVRDYIVGPLWWHRWSIACGYSFLKEAFVHEAIELDTQKLMPQLQTTVIPHGSYQFSQPQQSREEVRKELDIPQQAKMLLSFGHVRDGKNLDLILQAMTNFPDVYLVIAGKVSSSSQKPITYYQDLADSLGMSNQCRWLINFIPQEQVGNLFNACDVVLLTYSASFQSASGVLSTGVAYHRPCIASAGDGNLKSVVQKYNLGVFVKPDDSQAIRDGIQQWLNGIELPKWEEYEKDNSWTKNAEIICQRFWGGMSNAE